MPQFDFHRPRLFVADDLAPDETVTLTREQTNYLGSVLRLRSGQTILSAALFHAAFNTLPDLLPPAPGMNWLLWVWAGALACLSKFLAPGFRQQED